MKPSVALIYALLSAVCSLGTVSAGSEGYVDVGALESAGDREITRRQEDLVVARQLIKAGDAERDRNNIEVAYDNYKQAIDMVPRGPAGGSLRSLALSRFSEASVQYAEYLVSRGEYAEAHRVAGEVLDPRYNPDYRPAIVFLSRLEEADYFNKTVTPQFAKQRDEVNRLISEAVGFYDSGRYDMAQKRYRQVLAIDADNAAAFRGMEQVEVAKQRYFETAYNETRSRMLWQVERAWARPVPSTAAEEANQALASIEDDREGTVEMQRRLEGMVLDQVGPFQDAPIQEVVEWFRQKSREESGQAGPINITLQMPPSQPAAPPPVDATEETAIAPPLPDVGLVTMDLRNVPFYDALRYAATLANMKVRIDPFAVSIIPSTESSEVLSVREFKVPPDFLSAASAAAAEQEAPVAFAGRSPDIDYDTRLKVSGRVTAEEFFRNRGVEFPPGATASLAPGSTKLVVKNTPSALEFIQAIVEAASLDQPKQVEIDAKFVEVSPDQPQRIGL